MKVTRFEKGERDQWLFSRRGKITGSRLGEIYSKRDPNNKKLGFYALIAEKLGAPPEDDENQMERGTRLESEAVERYAAENKVEVDQSLILLTRDENENIAISPDGVVVKNRNMNPVYEEMVEAKCLSSAKHIQAFLEKKIPADYEMQALQYFVVCDTLQILHFIFYDPRFSMFATLDGKQTKLDYFEITITRAEMAAKIEDMLTYERKVMTEVQEIVNKLTF